MRNNNVLSTLITAWVAVQSVILFFSSGSARAQITSTNYTFVVASGFLCDPGDSGSCPAVAKSSNGDTYEISGAGTFDPQNKSVQAAGTFNHKATNGSLLEAGVWIARDFISFGSYGIAPAALLQKGPAIGHLQIGHKRLPGGSGPLPTGGLAIFRILLIPMSGATRTAVLQMNCVLGAVPRERSVEGIRLSFAKNGGEFPEEVSGRVMFLATRHEVTTPVKAQQEGKAPETSEQRND